MATSRKHAQEKDSLGEIEVPAAAYYGVQTQRAVQNYPISGLRVSPFLVRAAGCVKKAAAQTNGAAGRLPPKVAAAIAEAADDVISLKLLDQFVVDAFQSGAGVSFHMNVNEVIANRAIEILGGRRGDYSRRPSERPRQPRPVHQRRRADLDAPRRADAPARGGAGLPRGRARAARQGEGIRRRRQGRPHAHDGRRAADARAGIRRLRLGDRARLERRAGILGAPARARHRRQRRRHRREHVHAAIARRSSAGSAT